MALALFVSASVSLGGAAFSFAAAQPAPDQGRRQVSPAASAGARQPVEQSVVAPRPVVEDDVEVEPVAGPTRRPPPPPKTATAAQAATGGGSRPELDAEAVRIPALGIDQDLVELAVVGNDLQVPDDYADIGWWRDGPVPGQRGAAVVVGHVDSLTGPAVFYHLSGMRPGQRVVVERTGGSRAVFAVRRVEVYERTRFPSARVYRASGAPALHLVTCGGPFDAEAGHYRSNVVVFADLVDRVPAPQDRAHSRTHDDRGGHDAKAATGTRRVVSDTPRSNRRPAVQERRAQRQGSHRGAQR